MSIFMLTKSVTNNIYKKEQDKFIKELGLTKEYSHDGRDFHFFINDCVNSGVINREVIKKFLFEAIFYGQQRECYIYKMDIKVLPSEESLLNILNVYNNNIDSIDYNDIIAGSLHLNDNDLIAVKTIYFRNSKKISRVRLIFAKKVEIFNKKQGQTEITSYIAVEINYTKKLLTIKVAPKGYGYILDNNKQPDALNYEYCKKICKMFELNTIDYNNMHKEIICRMSKELYKQIYREMVKGKPNDLDEFIQKTSTELNDILDIEDLVIKKCINNIFNIEDNITKIVEHLLISDILYGVSKDNDLDNVEGLVTYLRFSDGKNISARLKGSSCREPIFDSEAFMSLRAAIENSQRILRLEVCWLGEYNKLRVTYDATSFEYLNIHFYKNLEKDEFEYAIEQFGKYESEIKTLVAVEARA